MTKMMMQNKSRLLLLGVFVLFFITFLIGNVFGWFGSITYIYEPLDVRFPENGLSVSESGDQVISIASTSDITDQEFVFKVGHSNSVGPENIAYTVGFQFDDNYVDIKNNVTFSATLKRQKLFKTLPDGLEETIFSKKAFAYLESYISGLTVLPKYIAFENDKIEYEYTLEYSITDIDSSLIGHEMVLVPRIAAFYDNDATLGSGGGVQLVEDVEDIDDYLIKKDELDEVYKKDGSTLSLGANILYPKTLFVSDFANNTAIDLNSYNLTVDGDLIFEYGGTTDSFLDLTGGGILTVNGDLIIKMPYAQFKIEGDYLESSYAQLKVNGKIYADVAKPVSNLEYSKKHTDAGLYIKNIHMISLQNSAEYLGADLIIAGGASGSAARVFIDESSFLGLVATEIKMWNSGSLISRVSDIEIINYGQIGYIDLSSVGMRAAFADHLIEIYNDGEIFGRYTEDDVTKYHVSIPSDATYSTFGPSREVLTQGNTYMEVGLNSNLYRTNYRKGVEFYARKILVDNEPESSASFQTEHVLQIYSTVHFIYWDESGTPQNDTVVVNYADQINLEFVPKAGASWYSRTLVGGKYVSTPLDGLVDLDTFVISSDIYLYEVISFTINYDLADVDKAGFGFSAPNFSSNNQIFFDGGDVYSEFDGISFAAPSKENYVFEGWAFESDLPYDSLDFIEYVPVTKGYYVTTAEILENGTWDSRTASYTLTIYSYWDPYVIRLIRNNSIIGNYNNFSDAYTVAQSGDRIELLNDYFLQTDLTIDKNITFDLGAYQLTLLEDVDLIIIQGYVLGSDDCFITDSVDTTIEIYAAADASKITGYINGIQGQTFYRSETTKYIAKDLDATEGVDISWCEYFTINLYKPWLVQTPTDEAEHTFSTYFSNSITSDLAVYETGVGTSWVPLATTFVEWQDLLGNRTPIERLEYLISDMDLYFEVNAMAAISVSGDGNGTTDSETMLLKNTVDFTIASVGSVLNIQNTSFSATLNGSAWKTNSNFDSTTKRLSLVSDTSRGNSVVTAIYTLVDPQSTSTSITVNGQSTVQGTWTAIVRYPQITYDLGLGYWQWPIGPTEIVAPSDGYDTRYEVDTNSKLPEIFTADFYHYLVNTTYEQFDAAKSAKDKPYETIKTYSLHSGSRILPLSSGGTRTGILLPNLTTHFNAGSIFSLRNSSGTILTSYYCEASGVSTTDHGADCELYKSSWAMAGASCLGYSNFLFRDIQPVVSAAASYKDGTYNIIGGFLGTEPYKTRYKPLVDLIVAIYIAQYGEGATRSLFSFNYSDSENEILGSTGVDPYSPYENQQIKKRFAWAIEGYFYGQQDFDLVVNLNTNPYNRVALIRDARKMSVNTNLDYSISYNTTTGAYTLSQEISGSAPTGKIVQETNITGGTVLVGYGTESAGYLASKLSGFSGTDGRIPLIESSVMSDADQTRLYTFFGWSTVNPTSGSYSIWTKNDTCALWAAMKNGGYPTTISSDVTLYAVYKVSGLRS